jgi:hypothetical protein
MPFIWRKGETMRNTRTASKASNVMDEMSVEEFASEQLKIIETGIQSGQMTSETNLLLAICHNIIVLQMEIYQELKEDLIKTGSET